MDLVLLQEMPSIKFVEGKKVKQNKTKLNRPKSLRKFSLSFFWYDGHGSRLTSENQVGISSDDYYDKSIDRIYVFVN